MASHKKRGRNRKMDVKRHACGHIIQPKPDAVAIEARMRVLDISKTTAKTLEAGHVLGFPLRNGEISRIQFKAGMEYLEVRELYRKSILTARMRSESDFSCGMGHDGQTGEEADYTAFCDRSVKRYRKMRRVVRESGSFSMMGLETWLDQSDATAPLPWHCLGDYRIAANALCKLLRLGEENEKKGLTYAKNQ